MPEEEDVLEVEDLTFDEEVELTMKATGADKDYAEFMVAIRRGEIEGDLEVSAEEPEIG